MRVDVVHLVLICINSTTDRPTLDSSLFFCNFLTRRGLVARVFLFLLLVILVEKPTRKQRTKFKIYDLWFTRQLFVNHESASECWHERRIAVTHYLASTTRKQNSQIARIRPSMVGSIVLSGILSFQLDCGWNSAEAVHLPRGGSPVWLI